MFSDPAEGRFAWYANAQALAESIHQRRGRQEIDMDRLDVQLIAPDKMQSILALGWTLQVKRATAYDSFCLAMAEAFDLPFEQLICACC